jgi:hypothetical protein
VIRASLAPMLAAALMLPHGTARAEESAIAVPEDDARNAAEAARQLGLGHHAEAAAIYERLVAPRHHTLAIRPEWHAALGRAYLAMGLHRAAQGQLRLALSANGRDDATAMAAHEALTRSVGTVGAYAAVPDTAARGGAAYYDLRTTRSGNLVRYRMGFAEEDAGRGWTSGLWETDCTTRKRRPIDAAAFDAKGKRTLHERGGDWSRNWNALSDNVAAMLCAPQAGIDDKSRFDMEALAAEYRKALPRP